MEDAHLQDLEGCTVAVDAYGWVHKGARACARELALDIPTTRYVDYVMAHLDLLLSYGLIPTLVFDGAPLPSKSQENLDRYEKRELHLKAALESEAVGSSSVLDFKHATKVTPHMLSVILNELKRRRADFLVAPYEADAQLSFLCKLEKFDAIISDDADMIPYGCKRVFFKLNWDGSCTEFRYANLSQFSKLRQASRLTNGKRKKNRSFDLSKFSHQQIIHMCVFSGCDYLNSVDGIKIGRAYELARDFLDIHEAIEFEKRRGVKFPQDYEETFRRAVMTYRHQTVFDPDTEQTMHLSPLMDINDGEDLSFLGLLLPRHIAIGIAYGDINPHTQLQFDMEMEVVAAESAPVVVELERLAPIVGEKVKEVELLQTVVNNEIDTVKHFDRQAPVASTPLSVQKTASWKSCCGLFDLFLGSER